MRKEKGWMGAEKSGAATSPWRQDHGAPARELPTTSWGAGSCSWLGGVAPFGEARGL